MVDQKSRELYSIIAITLHQGVSTFVLLTLGLRWFPVVETVLTSTAIPSQGNSLCDRESSNPVPWDILEGCGRVAGTFNKEGADVYLCLIHVDGRQKPAQYCKTIILQIKNKYVF